jgi:hypothetical protein
MHSATVLAVAECYAGCVHIKIRTEDILALSVLSLDSMR